MPTMQETPTEANRNIYCLLVGINNYPPGSDEVPDSPYFGVNGLIGCVSDINKIERYLKSTYTDGPNDPAIPGEEVLDQDAEKFKLEDHIQSYHIVREGFAADSKLQICRLQNKQATRANIIRAFREYLTKAGPNDKVWFHYSGHGTEVPTAEIFKNVEDGNDQCLVCYDFIKKDENGKSHFFNLLADKELAILLSEVAGEKASEAPHMVVTLDACHSGGGTRDIQKEPESEGYLSRMTTVEASNLFRDLAVNPYLDNRYSSPGDELKVPLAPHIVLTACSNIEEAGENRGLMLYQLQDNGEIATDASGNPIVLERGGGFFTQSLYDILIRQNGAISYRDLQVQTRAAIINVRKNSRKPQTPQFELIGGHKSYNRFLEGTRQVDPEKFEVLFKGGKWQIACGIIHGLPSSGLRPQVSTAGTQAVEIDIYEFSDAGLKNPVAKAKLEEVGPAFSRISALDPAGGSLSNILSSGANYYGVLSYLPADPEYVLVAGGSEEQRSAFIAAGKKVESVGQKNIDFITEPDPNKTHAAEVIISAAGYELKDTHSGKSFLPEYEFTTASEEALLNDLLKIVKWRRLIQLENTDPKSVLSSVYQTRDEQGNEVRKPRIRLKIEMKGDQGLVPVEALGDGRSRVVATDTNDLVSQRDENGERWYFIRPIIEIDGPTKPLFFYLYNLYSNKEIYGQKIDAMDRGRVAGQETYIREVPFNNTEVWGIGGDEIRDVQFFKLLITEEELSDYTVLAQDPIDAGNRAGRKILLEGSTSGIKDWTAVTLEVELIREEALTEAI